MQVVLGLLEHAIQAKHADVASLLLRKAMARATDRGAHER